jgi:hypothetical protein
VHVFWHVDVEVNSHIVWSLQSFCVGMFLHAAVQTCPALSNMQSESATHIGFSSGVAYMT